MPARSLILTAGSLRLTETNLGPESPALTLVSSPYASPLRKTKRNDEADALETRATAIMQMMPVRPGGPPI